MIDTPILGIVAVLALGIGSQWFAWRIRLPAILILLITGILIGPFFNVLEPTKLFGNITPFVSLAVALILYEGGLSLRFSELGSSGKVVARLVTIGAAVTFVGGGLLAKWILGFSWGMSALVGAIFTVTGPTMIIPLLRHIRPIGASGKILKWEGIVIDPIGALLAVLVFDYLSLPPGEAAAPEVILSITKTIAIGFGFGWVAARLLVIAIERFWVPEYLHNAVSLSFVSGSFLVSNFLQHEAGLFTVTIMGICLANQKRVTIESIIEFKENIRVLLISSLFVVLGATLEPDQIIRLGWRGPAFVVVLIVIVRPISVAIATYRSKLKLEDRLFLGAVAPRGIVAAAVSSIFALRLADTRGPEAELLVPTSFAVIIGTVGFYGLVAPWVARYLKLSIVNPQGIMFIGASNWVRALAEVLHKKGVQVFLVDNNRQHAQASKMSGLPAYHGSILSERAIEDLELGGIGRLFAVTPNDWVNVLAVQRFARTFGANNVYQVAPQHDSERGKEAHEHLYGQILFSDKATSEYFERRFARGAVFKATRLSEEFGFENFLERYGTDAIPLALVDEGGGLRIFSPGVKLSPKPGQTLVALVDDTSA